MLTIKLLRFYRLLFLASFIVIKPAFAEFERITLPANNERDNFASAAELKQQLNQLQNEDANLKAIVEKQQKLINTYERIIEQLQQGAVSGN